MQAPMQPDEPQSSRSVPAVTVQIADGTEKRKQAKSANYRQKGDCEIVWPKRKVLQCTMVQKMVIN